MLGSSYPKIGLAESLCCLQPRWEILVATVSVERKTFPARLIVRTLRVYTALHYFYANT